MTGRDLLFWSLFLPLLPQALWVRKTAARFPAADGPSKGEIGAGDRTIRLLIIGDSIVAGVGARTLDQALVGQTAARLAETTDSRVQWQACGKSGATSRHIAGHMLPAIDDGTFDAIVVSVGVNDVISLHGIARWRHDLQTLPQALLDRWPEAVLAFSGLPPMHHFPALPQPLRAVFGVRARQFDRILREKSNAYPNVVYIPLDFEASAESFSADGFHPSEKSYSQFGQVAAKAIEQALANRVDPNLCVNDRE